MLLTAYLYTVTQYKVLNIILYKCELTKNILIINIIICILLSLRTTQST